MLFVLFKFVAKKTQKKKKKKKPLKIIFRTIYKVWKVINNWFNLFFLLFFRRFLEELWPNKVPLSLFVWQLIVTFVCCIHIIIINTHLKRYVFRMYVWSCYSYIYIYSFKITRFLKFYIYMYTKVNKLLNALVVYKPIERQEKWMRMR